jgi:uncharacterized protein involved in exopolysaccharide biosynthesis
MGNNVLIKNRKQNEEAQEGSNEISLRDFAGFFKRNKLPIVFWGAAGLLLSTTYILMAQTKYEARWQMQMAQFAGANSEDPAALIQRLRMVTSYSLDVQESCGVHVDGDTNDYLDNILKVDVVKTVPNSVEMKVRASSPEQAKRCAETIFAMIVTQQRSLIEERMAGRQEQLKEYQQALREEQQQLDTIKKTEIGNFGYLAKLDKLSWLRTRIDALQEESLLSQKHPTRLVAPIYVPSKPVSPKVGLLLLMGALLGLMLGLVYALGREGWRKAAMSDL